MTTQTQDFTARSPEEAKTYQLFRQAEWTPATAVIGVVFRAMWHASITQDRIEAIGSAMAGYAVGDLASELNKLVRAKVLRRRTERRGPEVRRFYEVNY